MVPGPPGVWRAADVVHNRRLKQRDSLPLNAAIGVLGDRKSPSVVQGQSSGGVLGDEVPQKLKGCKMGRRCPLPTGESERVYAPFPEFFFNFYLKMVSFGAFLVALYVIYLLIY